MFLGHTAAGNHPRIAIDVTVSQDEGSGLPHSAAHSHRATFGDDALKRFIAAYEAAGGNVWPHMFEHIVELHAADGIKVAEFAEISDSEDMRAMALAALEVP